MEMLILKYTSFNAAYLHWATLRNLTGLSEVYDISALRVVKNNISSLSGQ